MQIGRRIHLSRRDTLKRLGLTLAGASAALPARLAAASPPFFRSLNLPIGIQLYTVAGDMEKNVESTLMELGRIGYRTVELAGYAGLTAQQFRAALDRAGLRSPSTHVSAGGLKSDADLDKLAADARILGFDTVILPMFDFPARIDSSRRDGESDNDALSRVATELTAAEWEANADFMNRVGAGLAHRKLKFGFHNHNLEFVRVGDRTAFDILLRRTNPRLVQFEMDVGWVVAAGYDPVRLMADHPGRFTAFHVKDLPANTPANTSLHLPSTEVGAGSIDWSRVLTAGYRAGVRRFFVEQEPPFRLDPLESARLSFDFLNRVRA